MTARCRTFGWTRMDPRCRTVHDFGLTVRIPGPSLQTGPSVNARFRIGPKFARRRPMGRIPRNMLVGTPSTNHVTWRCHNGMKFFTPQVATKFLDLMGRYKDKYGILIHSYCL